MGHNNDTLSGSPDYSLWEETHVLKVMGLNPGSVFWIDTVHINSLFKLYCYSEEKTKIEEKRPGMAQFLKR